MPFAFQCIPQYETERILGEHLAAPGHRSSAGWPLQSLRQDDDG